VLKLKEVESAEGTASIYSVVNPGGNVTSLFSSIMLKNATRVYQYRIEDKTVPVEQAVSLLIKCRVEDHGITSMLMERLTATFLVVAQ